jgi:hypothetical protein
MNERCACGRLFHYSDPITQATVETCVHMLGSTIAVTTPSGTWLVPRHYIALHGFSAYELPSLAAAFGWTRAA